MRSNNRIKDLVKKAIVEVIMESPAAPEVAPPPTKPDVKPTPKTPQKPRPNHPLQPGPGQKPRPKGRMDEAPASPEVAPPPTKPTTEPKAPPAPSKPRPQHPIQPGPGQKPRPKGNLSHDTQLFINARKGVKEAINIGDYPEFIDPGKRASIEDEQHYVETILPDLGPNADRYLEIITSESYKKALDRAAHYLGIELSQLPQKYPNMHTAVGIMMETAHEVENLERNSKPQLERMAIEVVLNLEENKFIKSYGNRCHETYYR